MLQSLCVPLSDFPEVGAVVGGVYFADCALCDSSFFFVIVVVALIAVRNIHLGKD